MKYHFKLPDFPNSNFEIETRVLTGKSTITMDGIKLEQSKERGRPFLVHTADGAVVQMFPKPAFPETIPTLQINGVQHRIVEKLKWYEYLVGGLPLILVFGGGVIGGIFGALAAILNFNIFRQEGSHASKYLKVGGVIVASVSIYLFLVFLMVDIMK